MEQRIIDRVMELIFRLKTTAQKFERDCGIPPGQLSVAKRPNKELSMSQVRKIELRYDWLNKEWLENGTGSITVEGRTLPTQFDTMSTFNNVETRQIPTNVIQTTAIQRVPTRQEVPADNSSVIESLTKTNQMLVATISALTDSNARLTEALAQAMQSVASANSVRNQ